MNSRRRDDRSAPAVDHYKQWVPTDNHHDKYDYEPDRRRNRSSTLPSHSYDQRPYPTYDTRYQDARQPSRSHRQDPHYTTAPPSSSYHQSSAPVPSTSRTYQHATRPSAQYPSSGHHYPQPTHPMSAHPLSTYPVASSSRKPYPEVSDPRTSRRPVPAPTHQSSYEQASSGDDIPRSSRHPSRAAPSQAQPPQSAPANQSYWTPAPEMSSRRPKDPLRDRDRDREKDREREREREREKASTDIERDGYREKARVDRYRERASEIKYQEYGRSKHSDRRKDSDTEGVMYSEQRNVSKASLSGREGYPTPVRESSSGHRRHRTEDGTAATSQSRRNQPENTQNPITTIPVQSPSGPTVDGQHTAKSHRSHREGRPSTSQGAQSGSDTERSTGKHRMERTPSGPAVQRTDGYTSSSARDRGNHEVASGSRDDLKRPEAKYGVLQDTRQPPPQANVGGPLVTPGFHSSSLPTENPLASVVPQFVSIRAGQGPSDPQPYDVHFKSSAISHSDVPQDVFVHPHATSASIIKPSSHTRSQSSEIQTKPDRQVAVDNSRTEPHGIDLPSVYRMSVHESSRTLPTPISRSQSYARGYPETVVDNQSSSRPPSRPPSRSAHRASVVGPRAPRSVSQAQVNEPPTHPPSDAQHLHSIPPSPPRLDTPASLEDVQFYGTSSSRPPSVKRTSSGAPPTPVTAPQTPTASSRPSTRQESYADAPNPGQDRPSTTESRSGQRKASASSTMKAAWIVQTAPAAAKGAVVSREEKYLRGPPQTMETPHPQLRQVLQDDDPFPHAASSMMKASQAVTPQSLSQRNSPGAKAKDVLFSTPRGTSASNSPKSGHSKEAPTPEHKGRPNLPSHLAGPPQIAIVGATPVSQPRDLPHQGRVDHSFLVPAFPAPTRVSRTTSSSREQQQTTPRNVLPASHQPPPELVPVMHTPSLFQPYRPPTPPLPEESAQSSPPPLPIPPPGGFDHEDSPPPPPPIEMRMSEIIHARSQDKGKRDSVNGFPHAFSEIVHKPSQQLVPGQSSPPFPVRMHEILQNGKLENHMILETTPSGTSAAPRTEVVEPAPAQLDVPHSGVAKTIHATPLQISAATRSRPKVTIEDVPEDSPVGMNGISTQVQQHTTVSNPNTFPRSASTDQGVSRSSPRSKTKESPLHRASEPPSVPPVALPPTPPATTTSRMPFSAPPNQPSFFLPLQPPPHQRSASQTVPSRTLQRATEMMQASKLSTTPGGTLPTSTTGISKTASAPVTMSTSGGSTVTGHQPLTNAASTHVTSTTKLASASTTLAPHVATTTANYATKVSSAFPTMIPPVGMTGLGRDVSAQTSTTAATTTTITGQALNGVGIQASSSARLAGASIATPHGDATTATYAFKVTSAHPTTTTTVPPVGTTGLGRDGPAQASTTAATVTTSAGQQQAGNGAGMQAPLTARIATATATTAPHIGATAATYATKISSTYPTTIPSLPLAGAIGRDAPAPSTGTNTQSLTPAELYKQQVTRATASQIPPSLDAPSTTLMSSSVVKIPHHDQTIVDSTRLRDGTPAASRNVPPSSHLYSTSARPVPSSATTAQHHHRVVSLPTPQASSTPSPRKISQAISSSTAVSSHPFPPRSSPPDLQPTRVPASGHLSTPAPPRAGRLPSSDRVNDTDILKTPSSIAPSPMLNVDSSGPISRLTAPPMRKRLSSTDSKDSKKKSSGLFGLFRTRTLSSKQADPPVVSTTTKPSVDNARNHIEVPVIASATTFTAQKVTSTSAPRELRERDAVPPAVALPSQPKVKASRVPNSTSIPLPPAMAHRDTTPHIFTPFKFLTMNTKRNRTISAASLDVCDGNTATNTVVGSPDHSTVSQAPPLPPIIPPEIRDPLIATTEWRDREEAERRERKRNRIRRPGVTFDLEEEPPSPAPGTTTKKNKLVRRPSGRAPGRVASTPGPMRS